MYEVKITNELMNNSITEDNISQKKLDEEITKLKFKLKALPIEQAEFILLKLMYNVIFDETREKDEGEWATMLYLALQEMYVVIVLTGEIPE